MSAPAVLTCLCRHSFSAHSAGRSKGCSFCSCPGFRDPSVAPPPPPEPLSDQAIAALAILGRNPAFKHVSKEHLDEIARHGHRRLFLPDAQLMEQGERSDSLHILVKGGAQVERQLPGRPEPLFLAELQPGDIVGEMGVLNGEPRSATVKALSDVETLEIKASPLKKIFQEDPDVLVAVMRVINERLKTTDDVVELSLKVALTQLAD